MDQMEKNPEQDFLCLDEAGVDAVRRQMPDEDDLYDLAELYKVFGDSTRVKILYVLFGAELCVRLTKPFFALVRNLVFFKTVERVEALVVMLWIFPDFLLVSAVLYSAQYCLRLIFGKDPSYNGERLTDFSGGRWVIWLCCAVCVAASLFIAPTSASLDFWSATIVPYVSLPIFFVLLPLIYAAGRMRKSI